MVIPTFSFCGRTHEEFKSVQLQVLGVFLVVVENPSYISISIVVLMFDNWWASLCWEK
jgi:hypothetical protein